MSQKPRFNHGLPSIEQMEDRLDTMRAIDHYDLLVYLLEQKAHRIGLSAFVYERYEPMVDEIIAGYEEIRQEAA